jgi:hypothetical protein
MIENLIKAATCIVKCGTRVGTGQLVDGSKVLTARHCVQDAIEGGHSISLTFSLQGRPLEISATVLAHSPELDVCLLQLSEKLGLRPVPLSSGLPTEGRNWMSFGYPRSKNNIGHRLGGTVSQVLTTLTLKIDLDLAVEPSASLDEYEGMSGSGVFSDGVCKGIVRLNVDRGIAAVSIFRMTEFLTANDVPVLSADRQRSQPIQKQELARRIDFDRKFDETLSASIGSYMFLEGAHGIGKSTFCSSYEPLASEVIFLGTYSLTAGRGNPGPAQRSQPEVFVGWLATVVSQLLTGSPGRVEEMTYAQLVESCLNLLNEFSQFCAQQGRRGVLFVDGLNEAHSIGDDALTKLIGLLPIELPDALTVVLTAPNFDSVAPALNGRVKGQSKIALPPLSDDAAREYCGSHPGLAGASAALVSKICAKAKGHPLYLRYVIEYASGATGPEVLDDFPEFSGVVEDYYEVVWSHLHSDSDIVGILALIARLRAGIRLSEISPVLTQQETASFVGVIARIRHLLLRPDETTIYHPSFAYFLVEKTKHVDVVTHERLANFCSSGTGPRYCTVNLLYHLLRSTSVHRALAVTHCTQTWVDRCVTLGAKGDLLLQDVDEVIGAATTSATATEILRLLLLSQRIKFRYNVLLAQSAGQVAEALVALGRPEDAFNNLVRFDTVFVPIDEALRLAYQLIESGFQEQALRLLSLLYQKIDESFEMPELDAQTFLELSGLDFLCLYLMHRADGVVRHRQLQIRMHQVTGAIDATYDNDLSSKESALNEVRSSLFSTIISLGGSYTSISALGEKTGLEPASVLSLLVLTVLKAMTMHVRYGIVGAGACPPLVFQEMLVLLRAGHSVNDAYVLTVADAVILCSGPLELVEALTIGSTFSPKQKIQVKADDGINVKFMDWFSAAREWRVVSYLTVGDACPTVALPTSSSWLQTFDQLVRTLFWFDGKARRALIEEDDEQRRSIQNLIQERVWQPLEFSLAQRIEWRESYFVPEHFLPDLYELIFELYLDCFPEEVGSLLQSLITRLPGQCGIYSEGFRRLLRLVVDTVSKRGGTDDVKDRAFDVLKYWKDYVLRNVQNRHELVPELLDIIPACVRLGASEMADTAYQDMLNVSMGPSWYKEDQFGLMNTALQNVQPSVELTKLLPHVAGYLELASGEMTFQRFVRYDKSALLKELFDHGYYSTGARYFTKQTCGEVFELLAEANEGDMDRAGLFAGGRYPGKALDEQAAMRDIVLGAETADWRVRWALLEIYQYGDDRHLQDYANLYAKIINTLDIGGVELRDAAERLRSLIAAEVSAEDQSQFVTHLLPSLTQEHREFIDTEIAPLKLRVASDPSRPPAVPKKDDRSSSNATGESNLERDWHIPGVIGTTSSQQGAGELLAEADRQIKRGNVQASKELAIRSLLQTQLGGGNIWGSTSGQAHKILLANSSSADELVHHYASLIVGESHVARWKVADHLIEVMRPLATQTEALEALNRAIEHVALMVGRADKQISDYEFMLDDAPSDSSEVLFDLLVWLVDHPKWLRKEKAGEMLVWLSQRTDAYVKQLAICALSMSPGFAGDLASGILDKMSLQSPLPFWEKLAAGLDIAEIVRHLTHVGRLSVLLRLAKRAAALGSPHATEVVTQILAILEGNTVLAAGDPRVLQLPDWAISIDSEWEKLVGLGIVDVGFVARLTACMGAICKPLDIRIEWQLEQQVIKGFGGSANAPLSRWERKVRFALNVALLPNATAENIERLEAVLRVFNPSMLPSSGQSAFASRAESILLGLAQQNVAAVTGYGDRVFLNYHELFQQDNESRQLEITAVLTSDYDGKMVKVPTDLAKFSSLDVPNFTVDTNSHDTCYRVDPEQCFLGSFTPAYPQPGFVKQVGAKESDFERVHWKFGRSKSVAQFGHPSNEGCMLTIRRGALALRPGWGLAWIIWLDGEHIASIRHQGRRG